MIQTRHRGPQRPVALALGGLTLVIPDEERRLTAKQWADLSCAVILDFEGRDEEAQDLVADLERRLGVHDAHRRAAATSPDTVVAGIRSGRDRRSHQVTQRARRLAGALRPPEPTDAIVRLVRRAEEAEAKADDLRRTNARKNSKAIKDHRDEAKQLRRRADGLRQAQLHAHWADQAVGESADYALARGEVVVEETVVRARFETDEAGAPVRHRRDARPAGLQFPGHRRGDVVLVEEQVVRRRVLSRDGLRAAYERGYLDGKHGPRRSDALYETGKRYGDAYETMVGQSGSKEGSGGTGPKGPQLRVAEAGEVLSIMRRGQDDRHVAVLDAVCGQGRHISEEAPTRGVRPALQRRLRKALMVAHENWVEARKEGRVGLAVEQLRERAEALARMR